MARPESGEVAVWYRIRLSWDEVENGEVSVIQGAFRACYVSGYGPRGMAMLGDVDEGRCYDVYFTPASMPRARALVLAYSDVPVDPPRKRGLTLLAGDAAEAWLTFKEF